MEARLLSTECFDSSDFSKEFKDPFVYLNKKIEKEYPDIPENDLVVMQDKKGEKLLEEIDYYYIAMDMDCCYGYRSFPNVKQEQVPHELYKINLPYFNNILKDLQRVKEGVVGISASNRIHPQVELAVQKGWANTFHIVFYKYFVNKIKKIFKIKKTGEIEKKFPSCEMDYFSLEDIFYGQKDGETFARICKMTEGKYYYPKKYHTLKLGVMRWDQYKISNLYAIMHRAAATHPKKNIVIDFSDDTSEILDQVKDFFTEYPQLIPPQVTLKIRQKNLIYIPGRVIATLKGTTESKIDYNYRYNVMKLHACRSHTNYITEKIRQFIKERKTEETDINLQATDLLVLQNILLAIPIIDSGLKDIVKILEKMRQHSKNIKDCIALATAIYEMEMFKSIEDEKEQKYTFLENTIKQYQLFLTQNETLSKVINQYKTWVHSEIKVKQLLKSIPKILKPESHQQELLLKTNEMCENFLQGLPYRTASEIITLHETCSAMETYLNNIESNILHAKLMDNKECNYNAFNKEIMIQHLIRQEKHSRESAKRELMARMPQIYPELRTQEKYLYDAIKKSMAECSYSKEEVKTLNNILDYVENKAERGNFCDNFIIEQQILVPYYQSIQTPNLLDKVFEDYHHSIIERILKSEDDSDKEKCNLQMTHRYYEYLGRYIRLFDKITTFSDFDHYSMVTLVRTLEEYYKKLEYPKHIIELIELSSLIQKYLQHQITKGECETLVGMISTYEDTAFLEKMPFGLQKTFKMNVEQVKEILQRDFSISMEKKASSFAQEGTLGKDFTQSTKIICKELNILLIPQKDDKVVSIQSKQKSIPRPIIPRPELKLKQCRVL